MTDSISGRWVAEARAHLDNLTADQVERDMADGHTVIVDVRDAPELAAGHLPGALHISRGTLDFKADPANPGRPAALVAASRVIVYCASGGRSALAAHTLQQLGYDNVAHLDGGFKAWIAAGKPVES